MQLSIAVPNRRFDYFCPMNRNKLCFPELMDSTKSRGDTVINNTEKDPYGDSQKNPMPQATLSGRRLSSATYKPTGRDIICGRGRGSFLHEGNKFYLSLLRKNIDPYLAAKKRVEKSVIISTIVSSLKQCSFRFLKQDEMNQRWYELSDAECYERTAHALRDLIRKKKGRNTTKMRPNTASRSSSQTVKVSSIASKKTKEKPIKQSNERLEGNQSTSLQEHTFTTQKSASLPLALEDSASPLKDIDAQSFDVQIGQIQPGPMSAINDGTDSLKTDCFDIFFEMDPNDFGRILAQLDTDKQNRRHSMENV